MLHYHGVIPAVMTPFLDGGKQVDEKALRRHIDFLIEKGVHGLFVMGTMGEGFVLSTEERKRTTEISVEQTAKRIPVVVQTTSFNEKETIELSVHAKEVGADGISVIVPNFYPFDHQSLKDFYSNIVRAVVDLPVYLYNNPGRSGNALSTKLVSELAAEFDTIVGIKDSSKDLILFQDYIETRNRNFNVIVGTDALVLPSLSIGGTGVVTAIGNPYPEPFVRLYEAFIKGDKEAALEQSRLINELRDVLKFGPYLAAYKLGLRRRGYDFNGLRTPLRDLNEKETAWLNEQLDRLEPQIFNTAKTAKV